MFHWLPKLEDCLSLIVGQHLKWLLKYMCMCNKKPKACVEKFRGNVHE